MTNKATTEVELTAAEIASQQGVHPKTVNEWRRKAESLTGKSYGTKRSKQTYYSASEVSEILQYGQASQARTENAPKQVYEADLETEKDGMAIVFQQQQKALVQQIQGFLGQVVSEEQAIVDMATQFVSQEARLSRIAYGIVKGLEARQGTDMQGFYFPVTGSAVLPPSGEFDRRRLLECL